jgi:hypothetical protein
MAFDDELKKARFPQIDEAMETAFADGTQYVREPDGTWRYADTWIKVPGARDLTLTEYFKPKFIVSGNEVERVVVSGEDIAKNPHLLEWCLDEGLAVRDADGKVIEALVPVATWKAHHRIPEEIVAPENSDDPAERELAIAEREYREADRALEEAAAKRAEVIRRHAETMTRQRARRITDLSVGRIQQLIKEGVDYLDQIDRALLAAAESNRPKNRKEMYELTAREIGVVYPWDLVKRRILSLVERGLLSNPRGSEFSTTSEGRTALSAMGDGRRISEAGDD